MLKMLHVQFGSLTGTAFFCLLCHPCKAHSSWKVKHRNYHNISNHYTDSCCQECIFLIIGTSALNFEIKMLPYPRPCILRFGILVCALHRMADGALGVMINRSKLRNMATVFPYPRPFVLHFGIRVCTLQIAGTCQPSRNCNTAMGGFPNPAKTVFPCPRPILHFGIGVCALRRMADRALGVMTNRSATRPWGRLPNRAFFKASLS